MKKITKLGLSALCGSLAAVSVANAGEIDVAGTAELTYTTVDGNTTGHPIGMKSNLSFTGTGELDGGQKVALTILHTDKNTWSAADITLTTNNIGTLQLSQGNGGGLGGYDDKSPTAWEEVWDTATGASPDLAKGVNSSTNINWVSPSSKGGTKLILAYAPQNDGVQVSDKSYSGNAKGKYKGMDVILDLASNRRLSGFVGYSRTAQKTADSDADHDSPDGHHEEAIIGAKFKLGPFSMGYQRSGEDLKAQAMTGLENREVDMYLNTSWGIAMNINDGLSVSYGEFSSNKIWTKQTMPTAGPGTAAFRTYTHKRKQKGHSWQAAYTIGGITMKYANTTFNNVGYAEGANKDSTLVSMGIAF